MDSIPGPRQQLEGSIMRNRGKPLYNIAQFPLSKKVDDERPLIYFARSQNARSIYFSPSDSPSQQGVLGSYRTWLSGHQSLIVWLVSPVTVFSLLFTIP